MKDKKYIKPSVKAIKTVSAGIIAGSDFGYGGPGDPSDGRAKESLFEGYDDYIYEGDFE